MTTLELLRSGQLAGAKRLTLPCGLSEFPREIFDLADTLEILDLSGNALTDLPEDLPRLRHLRVLFASNNRFTTLPAVLGQCQRLSMVGFKANQIHTVPAQALPPLLRWLILTDNQVATLPAQIGQCPRLEKLMLAGNRLHTLPPELAACTELALLRVSANQLAELPAWLTSMSKLAWLAFGGNPVCDALETQALAHTPIQPVAWDSLTMQQELGAGASGTIHQAQWAKRTPTQTVAVKVFKGEVTSDGLPRSEMAACLAAGGHPHLIPVMGQLVGHPGQRSGLVMPLMDPAMRPLAGPPSLDSCTRDVYAPEITFTLSMVTGMALSLASALRHMHRQGVMHGDVYAHNLLFMGQAAVTLGDFGAASFLPTHNLPLAQSLVSLEVRAFGHLLDEWLARCPHANSGLPAWQALSTLKEGCLAPLPANRPRFDDIVPQLEQLNLNTSA